MGGSARWYGVELVRGPFIELPPHPGACGNEEDLLALIERVEGPLAADLFCGAGGLSLGLHDAGFQVVVAIDNDPEALATHRSLLPGLHLDWDLTDDDRVEDLGDLLAAIDVALIAGGPPCQPFSKAGRSLLRDLVRSGRRPPEDHRRDLWQSFLTVVDRARPRVVVMENVPEMALERDMMIIRTMVDELEGMGYGVEAQVLDTWQYGVPQHRQRLILVGVADRGIFEWPHERRGDDRSGTRAVTHVTLRDAIGDLPPVEPGWRPERGQDGGSPYAGPTTSFQQRARARVPPDQKGRIYDHITRPVREDDLKAFAFMDHTTKYSDLPQELKRYRDDIFDDKYKRLDFNDLSRSITAHISKDGYWYIHPDQERTLTIREAARIQTFRDDVRFTGAPTIAFRQIGNAVPPLLAEQLGTALINSTVDGGRRPWTTREVSAALAEWYSERGAKAVPWLAAESRWSVLQAEILLARARLQESRIVWRLLSRLHQPADSLAAAEEMMAVARHLGREGRGRQVMEAAEWFHRNTAALNDRDSMTEAPHVTVAPAELAVRVLPGPDDDPVLTTSGVLRVAARFHGSDSHRMKQRSDGRMQVARLVGTDPLDGRESSSTSHLAHLGLIELGAGVCHSSVPSCPACPLLVWCPMGQSQERRAPRLLHQA